MMTTRTLLLCAAPVLVLAGWQASAFDDPLLVERRTNLPKQLPWPVEFFQPQVPVPGAPGPELPRAESGQLSIGADALTAARDYAQEIGSAALLVYHRGAVQLEWYPEGSGPDTISHTYHMQWAPLVLLVGVAIDEGHIGSVDDPAANYLPEWRNDARKEITLRHLLQQSAGLELRFDAHKSEGMFSRDARAYWGSDTEPVLINEYPAVAPPGSRFDYNYIVPELLGVILERATGRKYEEYLSAKLWKPLGNKTAYLWLNRPDGEAHQDAGLFSAPTDWLRLGVMLLQGGKFGDQRIVPSEWIDMMRQPSAANANFGFTWLGSPYLPARRLATDPRVTYTVHASEPLAADDVYYVDGYGGQRVFVVPSLDLVVVRIGAVARDNWDNSRLVNLIARGIKGSVERTDECAQQ